MLRPLLPAPPPRNPPSQPDYVQVKPGATITWVNNVGFPHNIVFDEDQVPAGVNPSAISREDLLNAPSETFRCGAARGPIRGGAWGALPCHRLAQSSGWGSAPGQQAGPDLAAARQDVTD